MRSVIAAMIVVGMSSVAGHAMADDKPYGVGFATVGQALQELQDSAKTDGRRLFCDGDKDSEVGSGDREVMRVSDAQAKAGLTRCAIFGKDENGLWSSRRIGVVGQASEFWVLALDDNGVRRIMQIQAFQPKEAWDSTSKALTDEFGRPTKTTAQMTSWTNAVSEIDMAHGKEVNSVFYSDTRLQKMMRERLGLPVGAGK